MPKQTDKLRDMERPEVFGYELHRDTLTPVKHVIANTPGDYGADPLGENEQGVFMFRMVPSGDIVDHAERNRRLDKRQQSTVPTR